MTLIAHVFTSSKFVPFVLPLLTGLQQRGYELCTISADGPELSLVEELGVQAHRIAMTRTVTPRADLKSLVEVTRRLQTIRPDLVHSHNPKAGLLGTIAARFAGIRSRIYHVHGSPLLTATGLRRPLFWLTESVSHTWAKAPLAVSPSLRGALVDAGVLGAGRARVLGRGSASGIDIQKFTALTNRPRGALLRAHYQIPKDALVLGFAGRLIEEKGLSELASAWRALTREFPQAWLMVAGSPDGIEPPFVRELSELPRVIMLGQVRDMLSFYESIDVLTLPSYREGLSTVLLEALAFEVPVVASEVVGAVDLIQPSVTGLLVPARDSSALASALRILLSDADARKKMGARGRDFVRQFFEREELLDALVAFYTELGFPPG
jgi:glycosyltransferase involved in cell wall biosynthesis